MWTISHVKVPCSLSLGLIAIFLFLIGGLTARVWKSDKTIGRYATLTAVFLCSADHQFELTPLTMMYTADIFSYFAGDGYGALHIHDESV
jgi:hypothetical protein